MKKIIVIIILFVSVPVIAQVNNNQQAKPYIDVTGKAEKEVTPNEIYISILLEERMQRGKKVTIQTQENQLKQTLQNIGVPLENLEVSDLNSSILKTGLWRKNNLAKAEYTLKLNGTENLKRVFESFENLKVKQARITKVEHSDIENLKRQNRIDAIKAAKEKANYLLKAIGEEVGKPMIVNERETYNYANRFKRNQSSLDEIVVTGYGTIDKPIAFEKIKIVSSVYVKFEIK